MNTLYQYIGVRKFFSSAPRLAGGEKTEVIEGVSEIGFDSPEVKEMLAKWYSELTPEDKELLNKLLETIPNNDQERRELMDHVQADIQVLKEQGRLEDAAALQKLLDSYKANLNSITTKTQDELEMVKASINHLNTSVDLKWNEDGTLTTESLIDVISDLDGLSGVEVTNASKLRQRIFGSGEQKNAMGEAQLKQLLRYKSHEELNAMYTRLTGDTTGLNFTLKDRARGYENDLGVKNSERREVDLNELNKEASNKIKKLQLAIESDALANAAIMKALTGDPEASAGLASTVDGTNDKLKNYLLDSKNQGKIEELLLNGELLKEDPVAFGKVVQKIANFGIQAATRLMTSLVVGGWFEVQSITPEQLLQFKKSYADWERGAVGVHMGKDIDKAPGANLEANLNLAGITLEMNWKNPATILRTVTQYYVNSPDKVQAVDNIASKFGNTIAVQGVLKSTKEANRNKINAANENFKARHKEMVDLRNDLASKNPEDPRIANIDAQMQMFVMTHAAQMLELAGVEDKGAVAAFTPVGIMLGGSISKVDTSSSSDKAINAGAAQIEAESNRREASDQIVNRYLKDAGVTQDENGNYIRKTQENGKEVTKIIANKPADGQKIIWDITEMVYMKHTEIVAQPKIVAESYAGETTVVKININNKAERVDFINKNSKQIADILLAIRHSNSKQANNQLKAMQEAISNGNIEAAEKGFIKIFGKEMPALIEVYKNHKDKIGFLNQILAKTSGGIESRKIADIIEGANNENYQAKLIEYFEKGGASKRGLARAFAEQYGIKKEDVMGFLNTMLAEQQNPPMHHSIGDFAPNGFTAMVAFNQANKAKVAGFRKLDTIHNSDAQAFGKPVEVTDTNIANNIRSKLRDKLDPTLVSNLQKELTTKIPNGGYDNVDKVKDLLLGGKVKAYFSYEENAECFNLGFMVEPLTEVSHTTEGFENTQTSTYARGASVNIMEQAVINAYIAFGQKAEQSDDKSNENNNEPKDEPLNQETTPDTKRNPIPEGDTPPTPTTPTDVPPPSTGTKTAVTGNLTEGTNIIWWENLTNLNNGQGAVNLTSDADIITWGF